MPIGRRYREFLGLGLIVVVVGSQPALAIAEEPDPAAAERGRIALLSTGYLKPAWSDDANLKVAKLWDNPTADPERHSAAFNQRYGLHPAPYPNDGLPMGLRRGNGPDGKKTGLIIDCLACHSGSIGGTSYVGLGNTQFDIKLMTDELSKVDGRWIPPSTFTVNSARGTTNAGMFSIVLFSMRNADLSFRKIPQPLGANLPELDAPAWWLLRKKQTMYYDGRTDAHSVRTNMQFLLGEKTLAQLKELESTFADIRQYLLSLKPPRYPFPIDAARADRGKAVFAKNCTKCHGTYGSEESYPNVIVDLKTIGTDPARALGISARSVAHYNETWFGEESPVDPVMTGYQAPPLDGIWATAPYLHNGSVPTLAALLKSSDRPARFLRPPSTDFANYDQAQVGWRFQELSGPPETSAPIEIRHAYYDTARFGLGNGGHRFGDRLEDSERADLIEYLKTL